MNYFKNGLISALFCLQREIKGTKTLVWNDTPHLGDFNEAIGRLARPSELALQPRKPIALRLASSLSIDQAPAKLDDDLDGSLAERADDFRVFSEQVERAKIKVGFYQVGKSSTCG